jgi:hypothetical protein
LQRQLPDEHLLTDYILGALSEDDTERLDKMSVTDGQFADRLRIAEDELVDAYVRGELSGENLSRFNSHYLASCRRREKVETARTLAHFTDRSAAASAQEFKKDAELPGVIFSERHLKPGLFSIPRLGLQWGIAAAALLLFVMAGFLGYQNLHLRNEVRQRQSERAELELREQTLRNDLATQESEQSNRQAELQRVRERLTHLKQQQSGIRPQEPLIVAFNLSPQMRGMAQVPNLILPLGTSSVALNLEVEATGFPAYQLTLKNLATGEINWRSGRIKASSNGRALRVTLPARILKTQSYLLELSAISAIGQSENVGSYTFKVNRP